MSEQENSAAPIGLGDFPAVKELGGGAMGKVFAVRPSARAKARLARRRARCLQRDGHILAMKQISKTKASAHERRIKSTRRENAILQQVRGSRFCLRHHCSFQTPSHLYLITEYCGGGDLESYLFDNQPERTIRGPFFIFLAAELISGLQFIHGKGIIHRDLKPANIMITDKGHVVIGDFGLAIYKEDAQEAKRAVGTLPFRAPETFGVGGFVHYSQMSDWWSLGVTLLVARTGQNPYEALVPRPGDSDREKIRKLEELYGGDFLEAICPSWRDFRSFMRGLLHMDPEQRLGAVHGAEEVKQHHLFSELLPTPAHWQRLEKHELTPPVLVSYEQNEEELLRLQGSSPIPVEARNDLRGPDLQGPDLFPGFSMQTPSVPTHEIREISSERSQSER